MARITPDTRALLRTIERSARRSSLFWWMVENHDEFASAARDTRIDWSGFCAAAAKHGLTDTRGQPPTDRNARETWTQARKAVARVRARRAAQAVKPRDMGATPPSCFPKEWRPEVVPPPPTRHVVPAPSLPTSRPSADNAASPMDDDMTPEGQAELDKIDRILAEYDRKKFRF